MKLSSSNAQLQKEFEKAYDLYADAIFRHCFLRVSDRELAKDLMQEAFMKTWEYLASGHDIQDIRPFLYRTAHNCVIDHVRKQKKRRTDSLESLQEEWFDVAGENGKDWATILDAKAVVEIFQKVREPYRTVLVLRYVDEMQPSEIAEMLHISANAVSVRITRGLEKLRMLLPDG